MESPQPTSTIQDTSFENLRLLLVEAIRCYEHLIDILRLKQRAIIDNNLEELRRCMESEQVLINKTQDNIQLLESLIATLAPNEKERRLKNIIYLAPTSLRTSLERSRQRLIASLEEISKINKENRYLLNFSLEYTKGVIRLLLRSDDENGKLYNVKGHVSITEKNNKLLNVQI